MHCHDSKEAPPTPHEGSPIVLVGNPNVGKSVLFSLLTRRYVTVSNYPGTTVEVASEPGQECGGESGGKGWGQKGSNPEVMEWYP